MSEIIYRQESYKIIGVCMNVYNTLGMGLTKLFTKILLKSSLNDWEYLT